MTFFLVIYLILALISTITGIIAYAKDNKDLQYKQILISLAAGIALGLFYVTVDSSAASGYYEYRINGQLVSGGYIDIVYGFGVAIFGGAITNLVGLGIGSAIYKTKIKRQRGIKSFSLFGKICCVFFLVEGTGGLITLFSVLLFHTPDDLPAVTLVLVSLIFLIPGLLLLKKWQGK